MFDFIAGAIISLFSNRKKVTNSRVPPRLPIDNKEKLKLSLRDLAEFLKAQQETKWLEVIEHVRSRLGDPATEAGALEELDMAFSGKPSINDITFASPETCTEGYRLLYATDRDMRLYNKTDEDRVSWEMWETKT